MTTCRPTLEKIKSVHVAQVQRNILILRVRSEMKISFHLINDYLTLVLVRHDMKDFATHQLNPLFHGYGL